MPNPWRTAFFVPQTQIHQTQKCAVKIHCEFLSLRNSHNIFQHNIHKTINLNLKKIFIK